MAVPVIMPRQGQSVESCTLTEWHKSRGSRVETGELLFSYETDKACFDEEAKVSGILLDIFFEEGDDVPCLSTICIIGSEDENPAGLGNVDNSTKISPRARNLAEKTGVDYRSANPTGPYGRTIERDIITLRGQGALFTASARSEAISGAAGRAVEGTGLGGRVTTGDLNSALKNNSAGLKAGDTEATSQMGQTSPLSSTQGLPLAIPAEALYDEVKISNIRKVIAKTMQHSLSSTAQLTLNTSFDATDILEYRKSMKSCKDLLGLENITVNDMIIFAVSRALMAHKDLNAHLIDDRLLHFRDANVGIAVDTSRGLMVPTLFNANQKSLNEISIEIKKLIKDCQSGTINPDLLKNGSFTVTNLGTLDIESFTPVLNPPQTGILGANNIVRRVRLVEGENVFYPAMGLSLTFDHRALDGAPAARFLKELKNMLENFSALLAR